MCETKMLCHLDTVWGNSPIYLESQKVFPVLLLAWNVFASLCKTTCTLEGRFTFICSTSRTVSVLIENLNGRGGRTSRICDIMSSKANPGPRFSIHKCLLLNWKICREKPVVNSQHNALFNLLWICSFDIPVVNNSPSLQSEISCVVLVCSWSAK